MKIVPLRSFCDKKEETPLHNLNDCSSVISLAAVRNFFEKNLILPALTPQTALFGLWSDDTNHDEPIINNVLLIFKLHVYNSRENIV